jgi:carboxyl-terminal processing protease
MGRRSEGAYTGPVLVLIDALSYSCSEWFAAGMQAADRAVIIGERSPGGATGINVKTLPNGGRLAYPVVQLLAPDGTVLEGQGVIPEFTISLDRHQLLAGIDAQLEAAVHALLDSATEP